MKTILLLSDKSSGSTAVQAELLRHPEVSPVRWTMHNEYETLYWAKAASLLDDSDFDFVEGKKLFSPRVARRDLVRLIEENTGSPAPEATDEELVFEGWRRICEANGPVFFEKSPHHLNNWAATRLILRYAETTDHDVKVIGLVRNPLAVLYSAWTRWLTPPVGRQAYWLRTYRNLMAVATVLGPERFTMVRYEDLIYEPRERFAGLVDWLGLDPFGNVGSGVHTRSAQKWLDDPTFDLELDAEVEALAKHFGYTSEDLSNPDKQGLPPMELRKLQLVRHARITKGRFVKRFLKPVASGS